MTQHPTVPRLVYGHAQLHDCLAFANADTATAEAAEITALAAARTWGEARQVQMTHLSNPAGPECYEPEDYPDDRPFTLDEVAAITEGNWPPMVTERALTLLPEDLCNRFGKEVSTVHNGDYLEIPLDQESELVAALRERGYEVSRDDRLINVLDGQRLD